MLNQEKHRLLLFQILKDIFRADISRSLAFKGGTACYFLYGLDRFSTDIDLDIIDDARDVDGALIEILRKYGEIKKGKRILLSYGKDDDNIKIDLGRNIWKNNTYEIKNFFGTDIRVQTRPTIFANKLVALTERNTNRDIYDVYFFFQHHWDIDESLILERSGKSLSDILLEIEKKLKNLPKNYKILDGLGELLDAKQKVFVKERLITELLGIIELSLKFRT